MYVHLAACFPPAPEGGTGPYILKAWIEVADLSLGSLPTKPTLYLRRVRAVTKASESI